MYLVFDIGGTAIKYCYFDTKEKCLIKMNFINDIDKLEFIYLKIK